MDIRISTHAGDFGVVSVVGAGVDGTSATMIVSKIRIGMLHHDQDIAVPEAHAESTGTGHDRIVHLKDLRQAEM